MNISIKTYAKHYLKNKHWSVIPVGRDKKPLLNWKEFQERFASEEEIDLWFRMWPDANIGIVTGKISQLTVVDVEAGGQFNFPRTFTVATGGGGRHFYYKYQEGVDNKARILELTDIRGEGGFVVASPSIHASGKPYQVIDDVTPVPFPSQLFQGFSTGGKWEHKKHDWMELMSGSIKGSRNETAAIIAGKLFRLFGVTDDGRQMAWQLLVSWNARNNPPLSEYELKGVFASIGKSAINQQKDQVVKQEVVPLSLLEDYEVVHLSEAAKINDQGGDRYPTGFQILDESISGGFKDGDLIVISGISGHGKTSLAQAITMNLTHAGIPCLWFSYEVFNHFLWKSFQDMGMDMDSFCYAPLKNATGDLEWIKKKIKEAKEKFFVKAIFIDHLGFLEKKNSNALANYSAYIGELCRELKIIARDEKVFIVLMAHVNKTDNPRMVNLSHSAGIAQESDVVIMIKRLEAEKGDDIYTQEALVRVEKARGSKFNKIFKVRMVNGALTYQGDHGEERTGF